MHEHDIERAVMSIFSDSGLHAKQIVSISHATLGAVHAVQAGVASIGRAVSATRGVNPKHAIKQFDRFLSNEKIGLETMQAALVRYVIGARSSVIISLDWTVYADGDQHRIAINLITPRQQNLWVAKWAGSGRSPRA